MIKNFTNAVIGLLLAGSVPAFAQQYQTSLDLSGDDYGNKILIDGNSISVVGATSAPGAGGNDLMFLGGDLDGVFSEGGQAGGTGNETGRAICKFTPGTTAIAGASNTFSPVANIDDLMVLLLDNQGSPAWITVLGTDSIDRAFSVKEGNDGNVIVAGQTKQGGTQPRLNAVVAKLDAATGAIIWAKSIGGEYINEVAYDVFAINGLGYIVVGFSGINVMGLNEGLAVLLNEDGTKNAAFIFGGPGDDDARTFVDGGMDYFFIAGNAGGSVGQGNGEAFLARFNTSSFPVITMDWFKTYGGVGSELLSDAVSNGSGGVVLVGRTLSFGTGNEAFAINVDDDGVIQWSNTYGGNGDDFFQGIAEDGSGGFVAAGYSNSFGGTANNVWVVRMDAAGNSYCNSTGAAFVETTIPNNVAYADFVHAGLADIVSVDSTLTARDVSAIAFNQNTITENTLCTTVSVDDNSAANVVSIYPNPTGASLNFNFGVNAANAKGLVIYNTVGAKVYETTLSNITSVFCADISPLANGMYTAIVFMNDGQVTAKFTVAE